MTVCFSGFKYEYEYYLSFLKGFALIRRYKVGGETKGKYQYRRGFIVSVWNQYLPTSMGGMGTFLSNSRLRPRIRS